MSILGSLFGGKKQGEPGGVMTLVIVEARGLKPTALGIKRDAFCEVRVITQVPRYCFCRKTPVVAKSNDPRWGAEMVFTIPRPTTDAVEIKLYDSRAVGNNELLGITTVAVASFLGRPFVDDWIQLQDPARRTVVGATMPGALHVVAMYSGEGQTLPPLPPGWAVAFDPLKRPYFVNQFTGQTTWAPPQVPAVPLVTPQPQQIPYAVPPPPMYADIAHQQPQPPQPLPPTVPQQPQPPTVPQQPPQQFTAPCAPPPAYEPSLPSQPQQPGLYPSMPTAPPAGEDVAAFLTANNLSHLIPLFARERIDMVVLRNMSEQDLQSVGVESFGDRKKLLMLTGRS